jgi:putative membrane protein
LLEIRQHNPFRLFLIGGAIGVANIIPGVSGGTLAVVFGIYEDLMQALGNFITDRANRWKYIRFLVILFSGALIAIITLARVLSWSLENYPMPTIYFFLGLIVGSIPVVLRTHPDMKINWKRVIAFLIGIILVVALALIQGEGTSQTGSAIKFSSISTTQLIYVGFCGILSASAMIIPGVSGSFLLILLGIYFDVLAALSGLTTILLSDGLTDEMIGRLALLASLGVGIVIGILVIARIMSWALERFPASTMFFILGLIIGSLYQIYPGFEFTFTGLIAVITAGIGLVISLKFGAADG